VLFPSHLSIVDVTLATPEENLALDEALLIGLDRGEVPPCLRLWDPPSLMVVVGRSNRVEDEVHVDRCRSDGVPILRRCSGGGTVLLGPGCLAFSLLLPVDPQQQAPAIDVAIREIMSRLTKGLADAVPGIAHQGISDLTVAGQKVSGNAQRWMRRGLLHHGTLLYDFPAGPIERYLRQPRLQPEYRQHRPHPEFVTNLSLPRKRLGELLREVWNSRTGEIILPLERVAELTATKYRTTAWNFCR
jgi:lipoate-protein ligase A